MIDCHDLAFAFAFLHYPGIRARQPLNPTKANAPRLEARGREGGKVGQERRILAKCYELSVDELSLRGPKRRFVSPQGLINHDPLMQYMAFRDRRPDGKWRWRWRENQHSRQVVNSKFRDRGERRGEALRG